MSAWYVIPDQKLIASDEKTIGVVGNAYRHPTCRRMLSRWAPMTLAVAGVLVACGTLAACGKRGALEAPPPAGASGAAEEAGAAKEKSAE